MKFIHLSDLHIGKHLYHYNMKEDQEHILEEVIGYTRGAVLKLSAASPDHQQRPHQSDGCP